MSSLLGWVHLMGARWVQWCALVWVNCELMECLWYLDSGAHFSPRDVHPSHVPCKSPDPLEVVSSELGSPHVWLCGRLAHLLSYRNTAMGQSCGSHHWTLILKNKVIPATTPSTPVWPSCTYTVVGRILQNDPNPVGFLGELNSSPEKNQKFGFLEFGGKLRS